MKFAETPVQNNYFVYLKDEIRQALKLDARDVLEWHITNQTVTVKKKEGA